MNRKKIAVIGLGAVGGYYGAHLAAQGHQLSAVVRADADQITHAGLHVRSDHTGPFHVSVQASADPAALGPQDIVFIALKTTANAVLPTLCHLYAMGIPSLSSCKMALVSKRPWPICTMVA